MVTNLKHLWLFLLFALSASALCLSDQRVTKNEEATSEERLTKLQTRDTKLYDWIGKKIGDRTVKSIRYLGSVDVEHQEDKEIGFSLKLNDVGAIDTDLHIADFQLHSPMKNDSIEATVVAKPEEIGKKFVIIFNINSFGKFDYAKSKRIGDGQFKQFASDSGTGYSVGHIPTILIIKSTEPVTLKFAPETDDRWWFHSCDLYIFEEEASDPTAK